jgi:glycosyltransferase involved in cell wall biosynthesis
MPRVMACTHSRDDPASRFRVLQYVPHLAAAGWQVTHRPNRPSRYWRPRSRYPRLRQLEQRAAFALRRWHRRRDIGDAAGFDAVLLNRDLYGGDVRWEQRLFARNPRVVFDFDDAIFLGAQRRAHIGWICRHAAWVTAGNAYLADFARQFTARVTVLPSVVDVSRYGPHVVDPTRRLRVGWLGSDLSIRETLFPYWELFARLQQQVGFELVICSRPRPEPPSGALRWSYVEWTPQRETEIGRYCDVGVMPLLDSEFQRGKCGLKLLQYMAAALPVVASPVGVNRDIVRPGETGYLAQTEPEWRTALLALRDDAQRRHDFGRAGRQRCTRDFSLAGWAATLRDILQDVAAQR